MSAVPAASLRQRLAQTWGALAERERMGVAFALTALTLLALWLLAIQPAWRTLRAAPAQHAALDRQLESMQQLTAQAKAVGAAPKINPADAARALQAATTALGAGAELRSLGDRATVRLRGINGEALARWLTQVREGARAVPVAMQLTRAAAPAAGASAPAAAATGAPWAWDGTIELAIHAAP
jgi:general secretion pathway protein M